MMHITAWLNYHQTKATKKLRIKNNWIQQHNGFSNIELQEIKFFVWKHRPVVKCCCVYIFEYHGKPSRVSFYGGTETFQQRFRNVWFLKHQ